MPPTTFDVESYRELVLADDVDDDDLDEGVIAARDPETGDLFMVRPREVVPPLVSRPELGDEPPAPPSLVPPALVPSGAS